MTPPARRARAAAQGLAAWPLAAHGGAGSSTYLVLPIGVVVLACALAAYAYARRKRRTNARTTPASSGVQPQPVPLAAPAFTVLDAEVRAALVAADEAVRTSAEELDRARSRAGAQAVRPFGEALAHARSELAGAFRLRQELDEGRPEDEAARRRVLAEMEARCEGAGRRLDAEAAAFDRLRGLGPNAAQAVASAEAAFRELTTRTGAAEATLTGLLRRYAPSATASVARHVEEAKDRLMFATTSLGGARQALDADDGEGAAVWVRAAEGAVAQVALLVASVERRERELADAAGMLPDLLATCEAALADSRRMVEEGGEPSAALRERITRAESALAAVREESTAGPYDPIDALRRVQEADTAAAVSEDEDALPPPPARAVLNAATLAARASVAGAGDHIATRRGAVGSRARTRLAAALSSLESAPPVASDPVGALDAARAADALAREALALSEQDAAAYGQRDFAGRTGDGGLGGALLGGIILDAPHDGSYTDDAGGSGGSGGSGGDDTARRGSGRPSGHAIRGRPGGPACFGGPATRARRAGGGPW
ncbi:TPM domain-containing protein [Streptomyces sp. NPDC006632]|uniref:TPM domain-containing protein n=1 Tax=Streptomyces sp. NPDC006632 TaxID=3157182 RepID=UPI0033A6EAD6